MGNTQSQQSCDEKQQSCYGACFFRMMGSVIKEKEASVKLQDGDASKDATDAGTVEEVVPDDQKSSPTISEVCSKG